MDKYYEQLTPAYKGRMYGVYNSLAIVMGVLFILTITTFIPLAVVAAGLAVLFYFLKRKEYVEYEYAFTSGDIDIDMVIEAKKKKAYKLWYE